MSVVSRSKLFGSRRRTSILLLLELLEESYASEISRLLQAPLYSVQKVLAALEDEGILVAAPYGREQRFIFNPRYVANSELRATLRKLIPREPEIEVAAESLRRRPRRRGKAI